MSERLSEWASFSSFHCNNRVFCFLFHTSTFISHTHSFICLFCVLLPSISICLPPNDDIKLIPYPSICYHFHFHFHPHFCLLHRFLFSSLFSFPFFQSWCGEIPLGPTSERSYRIFFVHARSVRYGERTTMLHGHFKFHRHF